MASLKIPSEMQRGLVNKKKMKLGRISVAFSKHPRIAHCSARIYGRFVYTAKAVLYVCCLIRKDSQNCSLILDG